MAFGLILTPLAAAAAVHGAAFEALQPAGANRHCLVDASLCLEASTGEDRTRFALVLTREVKGQPDPAPFEIVLPLGQAAESDTDSAAVLWPRLFVMPGDPAKSIHILAGVITRQTTAYSGGGGAAEQMHLFEIVTDGDKVLRARQVLEVPTYGSLMIRSCFSEADYRDRQGACHDEYTFGAKVSVAGPAIANGLPVLRYTAKATRFPASSSRSSDNTGHRLSRRDLVTAVDPDCTFVRTLRFDQGAGEYRMNAPSPDCSDYTTP